MDTLRRPLFVAALVLAAIIVLVEVGAAGLLRSSSQGLTDIGAQLPAEVQDGFSQLDQGQREELGALADQSNPGLGIPYMALLDGVVLFTVGLVGLALLVPQSAIGRAQGCATAVFALLLILAAIVMIVTAIALVLLMITLLLSVPFGTIAYVAIYGFFPRGSASAALSVLMLLKLGFAVCLILAQQRFLQNRGLVLIVLTSLVANVIISFLHGLVPGFLVSITDGIAAIVVAVLAVIWAILLLIGSLPAIIKALKPA